MNSNPPPKDCVNTDKIISLKCLDRYAVTGQSTHHWSTDAVRTNSIV